MTYPTVCFVGLGYIGLPTAVIMAKHGVEVTGVDIDQEAVNRINRGESTIVEPGLQEALVEALNSGRFTATTEMVQAETYVVAVPTPFTENHDADLSYVMNAASSIATHLSGGELIILESTCPPLSTRAMADKILEERPDLAADGADNPEAKPVIYFAHCPERILPGRAMEELITNDRIIGGESPEAAHRAIKVYSSFCRGQLLPTTAVTAEMAKLTENAFRDVNIAFANELSLIADTLGINVWELIDLANHHPRVNILQPGPGVGGHCIAVDPWFVVSSDPENSRLIRTAREVNDAKPGWVIQKVHTAVANIPDPVVAVLGLSFKADIDDLRESPALTIARNLATTVAHAQILAAEPNITELPGALDDLTNVELTDYEGAVARADVVLLLVDHREFKQLPATALQGKTVIDTKGIWR